MNNADYILSAKYVLTMNSQMDIIHDGAIVIKNNKIIDLGAKDEILKKYIAPKVIAKKNHIIMPGLINTHVHAAMSYLRGFADDLPLREWLEHYIWPIENIMISPEFVYDGARLACLEMLKGGITSCLDMYYYEDKSADAIKSMQMRALTGQTLINVTPGNSRYARENLLDVEQFILQWKDDDLIMPILAPHSLYACDFNFLKNVVTLAHKYNTPLHIHLSEPEWEVAQVLNATGKRPVEYLQSIGFFEGLSSAAHCIWVDDKEIEILAKYKVSVSHCLESNLKMAAGFAPVVKMLNAGVNVTLGTDSAVSNNDLNIFSEMSTVAKVHKALVKDPTVLNAPTVLQMATKFAAKSLGFGDKLGILAKDYLADLICVDIHKPHLLPIYDVYSHLVYAASASDVDTVMVNGKILMDNRQVLVCDESEVLNKAIAWQGKIMKN